jgi:hypothetical protein
VSGVNRWFSEGIVTEEVSICKNTPFEVWVTFSFPLPNHLKIDVGGIENLIVQEAYEILQKSELQTIQIEISINNEQMGDMVK